MNIVEIIQKNLGFEPLKKIDPNTQETAGVEMSMGNSALAQAGIPSILLGIYNKLEQEPEISWLDTDQSKTDLMETIFGKTGKTVVLQINQYAKLQDKHSDQQLEHIASEAMRVVKENIKDEKSENSIRSFVAKYKPETLLYLPAALQMGIILQNNNLDDRTAKMEGPLSSLMHSVEKTFNSSQNN